MPRMRARARPSASASRLGDRQLDGEQRALVLADAELGERELVVPAQQPAVRLAEHVADRRRVVRPADERERRIEDDRDAEVEAAASVEDEIPAGDPIAVGSLGGRQARGRRASARRRPGARCGRPGRRMTWPAESSRDGRRAASGRSVLDDDPLAAAGRAARGTPPTTTRSVGRRRGVVAATARLARGARFGLDRLAARARRGPAKSDERTSAATLTLRPMRAPRGMTARLPTTVMPVLSRPGSCLFGRSSYGPVADDRALADDDLLVEDRPVDDGARADDRVEHDDRVAHDRARRRPGRPATGPSCTTVPAITQPWLMRLRWTWAVGPTLAGARSSERVWMTQSLSYRSSSGSSSRSAMLASQYDWIVPTSCQ